MGDQKILVVRDDAGALQAFHNTCRHRGAELCRESAGSLRTGAIVCPYHAWMYNLQGELLRTSSKAHPQGFDLARLSALRRPRARVARLRVRVPGAQSAAARAAIRSALESHGCMAARGSRARSCALEDHREQLEDLLGELQRVPALSRACIRDSRASCRFSDADFSRNGTIRNGAGMQGIPIRSTRGVCAQAPPPGRRTASRWARLSRR